MPFDAALNWLAEQPAVEQVEMLGLPVRLLWDAPRDRVFLVPLQKSSPEPSLDRDPLQPRNDRNRIFTSLT